MSKSLLLPHRRRFDVAVAIPFPIMTAGRRTNRRRRHGKDRLGHTHARARAHTRRTPPPGSVWVLTNGCTPRCNGVWYGSAASGGPAVVHQILLKRVNASAEPGPITVGCAGWKIGQPQPRSVGLGLGWRGGSERTCVQQPAFPQRTCVQQPAFPHILADGHVPGMGGPGRE